jgi:L-alanine-DL-glutamate epimerase-like enolase superfamily enzyme
VSSNPPFENQNNLVSRRHLLGQIAGGVAVFAGLGTGLIESAYAAPSASDLKIVEVKTFALPDLGFFVKLTTDSGKVGWGETDASRPMLMQTLVHDMFSQTVLGKDPFNSGPVTEQLFYGDHDFGPGGALANAIAGIDIAMWDLKGRILDVPIYRLLGGKYRNEIEGYGSYGTSRWRRLTPDQAAEKAATFLRKGFRTVKCRMQIRESNLNPKDDRTIEYVDTIRKKIGMTPEFFVDINNGYTAKRAIQIGTVLQEKYGMNYFEEPCSDQNHSESKQVVDALRMAIIAGEKEYTPFQVEELIRYSDVDYLNPDVVKAMGITGMHKMGILSQVNQKPIIMHNTLPVVSTAASLQLAAAYPIIGPFMEYLDVDDHAPVLKMLKTPFRFDKGMLSIPDAPGLGIEIDEDALIAMSSSVKVQRA